MEGEEEGKEMMAIRQASNAEKKDVSRGSGPASGTMAWGFCPVIGCPESVGERTGLFQVSPLHGLSQQPYGG